MGGVDWTKNYTVRHDAAPDATRINEEDLERWRSEVGFLFISVCLVSLFLISLGSMLQGSGTDMETFGGEDD